MSGLQKAALASHLAKDRGAAQPQTTHSHNLALHAKWLKNITTYNRTILKCVART